MTALAGPTAVTVAMLCIHPSCSAQGARVDVDVPALAFARAEHERVRCARCLRPLALLPITRRAS